MAKVLFLSEFQPNIHNLGGPTRLVYDILRAFNESRDEVVFCCPDAIVRPRNLPDSVRFRPWNEIARKDASRNGRAPAYLLHKRIKEYAKYSVDAAGFSIVVTYPLVMSLLRIRGSDAKVVAIGMDSSTLLFLRGFIAHKGILKFACLVRLFQVIHLEKICAGIASRIVTVGEYDADMYASLFKKKAQYIPHPLTDLEPSVPHRTWDGVSPLRVCFAGAMDRFYVASLIDDFIEAIVKRKDAFSKRLRISFLGKKTEGYAKALRTEGFDASNTEFAESFEDFLAGQDILIAPIAVGAGTKNRMLAAISIGLDVIGTSLALENISGLCEENVADSGREIVDRLERRLEGKALFDCKGASLKKFREWHSIDKWESMFWRNISDKER
jgi:hypothetical protein